MARREGERETGMRGSVAGAVRNGNSNGARWRRSCSGFVWLMMMAVLFRNLLHEGRGFLSGDGLSSRIRNGNEAGCDGGDQLLLWKRS